MINASEHHTTVPTYSQLTWQGATPTPQLWRMKVSSWWCSQTYAQMAATLTQQSRPAFASPHIARLVWHDILHRVSFQLCLCHPNGKNRNVIISPLSHALTSQTQPLTRRVDTEKKHDHEKAIRIYRPPSNLAGNISTNGPRRVANENDVLTSRPGQIRIGVSWDLPGFFTYPA